MAARLPGDTVVLRYVAGGLLRGALPTRAVSISGAQVVLWLAPGTPVKWPAIDGRPIRELPPEERYARQLEIAERPWTGGGVVIVGRPGRAHSIWLFREGDRFRGWYVNLEDPWRPSPLGFDTLDHELDIWVESDGSWEWKDERDLTVAVERGAFSAAQAAAIRAEGERVITEWPFPTGWEDWHPDESWTVPELPPRWDSYGAARRV